MDKLINEKEYIASLVIHQLGNYWTEVDGEIIREAVPNALEAIGKCFRGLPDKRFFHDGDVRFSPYMSVHWMIFLYRLARDIFLRGGGISVAKETDQIYYLNKIMHANDWFYQVKLPTHFLCEHPLGSVLGRAEYGEYLFVYQGTTVGGNRKEGNLYYPVLGNNVILYANATVLGNTRIGNNVVISADSYIINDEVPDNCVVFGKSPNLIIKKKSEKEIKAYTNHIWGWR